MRVIPDNGMLLARRMEMPSYSKKLTAAKIMSSEYVCGFVVEDSTNEYDDEIVVFREGLSIPLRLRNKAGEIVNYYLVKAELIVAALELDEEPAAVA